MLQSDVQNLYHLIPPEIMETDKIVRTSILWISRDEVAALNPNTHTHFKEFKTEVWQRHRFNWT